MLSSLLHDIRSNKALRNLIILAVIAFTALVTSILVVSVQEQSVRAQFVPVQMYPKLETRLGQVSKIVYKLASGAHGSEKITLVRSSEIDDNWSVVERNNYPAQQALIQKVLVSVSELILYQPRTARSERHHYLGLLAPENLGTASSIEFFDKEGRKIVSFLSGKAPERMVKASGEDLLYVRRTGEDQTWLARGSLPLIQSAQDCLDQTFLGIKYHEIKRVTLWAGTDHQIVISRATKDDNDFILQDLPKDRKERSAQIINNVAAAIADLHIDDVVPVNSLLFSDTPPKALFELFDGLQLIITITHSDNNTLWAKIAAVVDHALVASEASVNARIVEEKAAIINKRVAQWAYRLPGSTGTLLTQSMDLLTYGGVISE